MPGQRDWILDESGNLQLPRVQRDVRLFAEVQDRPVLDFMLSDGEPRHAVPIGWPASFGPCAGGHDVHRSTVQFDLALDVPLAALDEVRLVRH